MKKVSDYIKEGSANVQAIENLIAENEHLVEENKKLKDEFTHSFTTKRVATHYGFEAPELYPSERDYLEHHLYIHTKKETDDIISESIKEEVSFWEEKYHNVIDKSVIHINSTIEILSTVTKYIWRKSFRQRLEKHITKLKKVEFK